jgi:hypothetical protein
MAYTSLKGFLLLDIGFWEKFLSLMLIIGGPKTYRLQYIDQTQEGGIAWSLGMFLFAFSRDHQGTLWVPAQTGRAGKSCKGLWKNSRWTQNSSWAV